MSADVIDDTSFNAPANFEMCYKLFFSQTSFSCLMLNNLSDSVQGKSSISSSLFSREKYN